MRLYIVIVRAAVVLSPAIDDETWATQTQGDIT